MGDTAPERSDAPMIPDDSCCPAGCYALVPYTELACYNCPIQNRIHSSTCSNPEAVCAAPTFGSRECTIPETGETYLCLTISVNICSGGPPASPTPTPSPTPESCQVFCTDGGALRGADDCKYPGPISNGCPPFETRRGDCCYQAECPSPFPLPPDCPDGWTTHYAALPICRWSNCLPPNPSAEDQC